MDSGHHHDIDHPEAASVPVEGASPVDGRSRPGLASSTAGAPTDTDAATIGTSHGVGQGVQGSWVKWGHRYSQVVLLQCVV